jgi:cell division protein FtsL
MKKRGKRGLAFYALVGALSAGAAALAHVWVRMQVVELGYEIAREKTAGDELTMTNARLRIEVEGLKNPARVEQLAKKDLKMAAPDPVKIRVIPAALADLSNSPAPAPSSKARRGRW